ncbi:MAG: MMPL family transporter [Deltaproteobacteria bacterium]|nr:MMPL family transporter [Deltaproteobacteria bacterium]
MKKLGNQIIRWLTRLSLRRAATVSIIGSVLAVIGTYYTYLLYKNLRTNMEELLPTTARSVVDLDRVGKRLSSVENLVVLAFSSHTAESKRFVTDLAAELSKLPANQVAGVEYRIGPEMEFFRKRLLLFLEFDDLVKVRDYVKARVLFESSKHDVLGLGLVTTEPHLDVEALKAKYRTKGSNYDRFPDGFYASADETKRAVIVNLPGKASDVDAAHALKVAVEGVIARLNPKAYAPDIEIHYTGNTQNLLEEHAALVADLKFTTILVIILVAGAMLAFYRTFFATAALVVSLFMGTLWTLGLSYFLTGYLNANSAFLASIVIGNGINFGIMLLARYLEERRRGHNNTRAIVVAMKTTAKPTLTAALAAGLSYGSLMLTKFRGFSQFGVMGLTGMVLCWISAYTLLPSFLTVLEKWVGILPKGKKVPKPLLSEGLAQFIGRHPMFITNSSILATIAVIFTFFFHNPDIIEFNLNKLRDKTSMESGSGFYYHYIADIFGKNLSPMVLLPNSREAARQIAQTLKDKKAKEGADSQIALIQSLDDFIPARQMEKIGILRDFKTILKPAMMKFLNAKDREWGEELRAAASLDPFSENDLPPLILRKFTETDGALGRMVLVDKPVVKEGAEESALGTVKFIRDLRSVVDSVGPGTAIAGQLPITADMASAILEDGPKATLFACLAVFFLVVALFHNVTTVTLVSFALWVGVAWLAGIILGGHLKINFLNFIALPITFGIGVDYGVNIFQRYREEGADSMLDVIRQTGAAVGLCSLTTIIGYTSLIMASNQAFVSFGTLAVLGEICCVIAAVVSFPAFLLIRQRRRSG